MTGTRHGNRDFVAEFLAKGGKIARVPESATNGMSRKDWYNAERCLAASQSGDCPRIVAQDHLGRNWYANSEGEVIAHD